MSDLPPYPAVVAPSRPPSTKGAAVVRRGTGIRNPILLFASERNGNRYSFGDKTNLPNNGGGVKGFNCIVAVICLVLATAFPTAVAMANALAPAPTSNDGTAIDQGIAYILMLLALVLTYIIH